jgi:hypothetical protein
MTEEEKLIATSYICPKCGSLHMHSTNLEGNVCLPQPLKGKEPCDGILRRLTSADINEWYDGTTDSNELNNEAN